MTREPETPTTMDRARDLAELGDYVRTLADRMGMEGRTFEVLDAMPALDDLLIYPDRRQDPPSRWLVGARDAFFRLTPEGRRLALVREILRLHHEPARRAVQHVGPTAYGEFVARLRDAHAAIADAWAPCLPLPLVGLLRRVIADGCP